MASIATTRVFKRKVAHPSRNHLFHNNGCFKFKLLHKRLRASFQRALRTACVNIPTIAMLPNFWQLTEETTHSEKDGTLCDFSPLQRSVYKIPPEDIRIVRMSTIRHRGKQHEASHSSGHFERAPSEDEEGLGRPLLGGNGEPSSPNSPQDSGHTPVTSSSSRRSGDGSRWGVSIRETAVSVACGFMDLLPSPIQEKFLPIPPTAHVRFLDGWRDHQGVGSPYDKEVQEHVEQLRKLWTLSFQACSRSAPDHPEGLKSEEWKQFGFQGIDPATDFRGGGVFSLRNLVFLAELHPALFHECVHRVDYPFAVAGINVTMILTTLLHLNQRQTCLATRQKADRYSYAQARENFSKWLAEGRSRSAFVNLHEQEEEATRVFHEIYRLGCACVHAEWLKSNRNLMAFNSVLGEATKRLVNILKCSNSLQEAMTHLPQSFR